MPTSSPSCISSASAIHGNHTCSTRAAIVGKASSNAPTWERISGPTSNTSRPRNRNVRMKTATTASVRGNLSFCRRSATGSPTYASSAAATNGVSIGASKVQHPSCQHDGNEPVNAQITSSLLPSGTRTTRPAPDVVSATYDDRDKYRGTQDGRGLSGPASRNPRGSEQTAETAVPAPYSAC